MKLLHYANALVLVVGTVATSSAQVATQAKAPLTPETLALHQQVKRPLSIATAKPELSSAKAHSVLRNPMYAGAYALGKTESRTKVVDGRARKTEGHFKPIETWMVMLRDHHAG